MQNIEGGDAVSQVDIWEKVFQAKEQWVQRPLMCSRNKKSSKKANEAEAKWARETAGGDISEGQKSKEMSGKTARTGEDYVKLHWLL